jgi:hypothetical protein
MKTPEPRVFVAILVGVCILSSAIGAGIALLAETGPAGTPGKRGPAGPEGPEGPEGPSGAAEISQLEAEVEDLRGQVEEGEDLEGAIESLETEIDDLNGVASEICLEVELFC